MEWGGWWSGRLGGVGRLGEVGSLGGVGRLWSAEVG